MADQPKDATSPTDPPKEKWDFDDMYPERRGQNYTRSWFKTLIGLEGREEIHKMKCERSVYWSLRHSPLVKVLLSGLRKNGCDFDYRRHVSCEVCCKNISGGYDPELNQVVVCQNVARSKARVQGVLTHELIHMFDYCANRLDLRDIRHLACTEIRAANLAHCSFMSAWLGGNASPWNFKMRHKECVKKKALSSVMAVKNITKEEAVKAIDEVFYKCYHDLEPIGRRCRRNSTDFEKAYLEAPLYGYDYGV